MTTEVVCPEEKEVACKRHGCRKKFKPSENHEKACRYHSGNPVFRDVMKHWSCCGKPKMLEWDEFLAIPGCCVGSHTTEKPGSTNYKEKPNENRPQKIETPSTNNDGQPPIRGQDTAATVKIKSIEEMNKEAEEKKKKEIEEKVEVPMKIWVSNTGQYMCIRPGCGKKYDPEDNVEGCCKYHAGKPVFHDRYKYWSCCPDKKSQDWDDFNAVERCAVGKHEPRMVPDK